MPSYIAASAPRALARPLGWQRSPALPTPAVLWCGMQSDPPFTTPSLLISCPAPKFTAYQRADPQIQIQATGCSLLHKLADRGVAIPWVHRRLVLPAGAVLQLSVSVRFCGGVDICAYGARDTDFRGGCRGEMGACKVSALMHTCARGILLRRAALTAARLMRGRLTWGVAAASWGERAILSQ